MVAQTPQRLCCCACPVCANHNCRYLQLSSCTAAYVLLQQGKGALPHDPVLTSAARSSTAWPSLHVSPGGPLRLAGGILVLACAACGLIGKVVPCQLVARRACSIQPCGGPFLSGQGLDCGNRMNVVVWHNLTQPGINLRRHNMAHMTCLGAQICWRYATTCRTRCISLTDTVRLNDATYTI